MRIYLGSKENAQPTIFESDKEPSKETDPQYDVINGPFKSRDEAERCQSHEPRGCLQ
jgi:hypothetical protein